jgi:hypothetical protein
MFRLLKFLIWTGCAVALGVWIATATIGGTTPLEWMTRAWNKAPVPSSVETVKVQLEEKVQDAKDALSSARDHQVRERHSEKDKEAINKLIAKRTPAK